MNEKLLIEEAKSGNKHAMNILLQNNYKALYGFTVKMTANYDLSQDIVQEVCLKAVININKFKGESKFQSWLISIAINYYRDLIRKNNRMEFVSQEAIEKIVSDKGDELAERIQVKEVLNELNKLPYEKRIAFILKHYYGYSYDEISKLVSCSAGTVKSRIFYTITNLKKVLIRE